jgi:hypothetical protein
LAASSHDFSLVPTSSITLYTLSDIAPPQLESRLDISNHHSAS